MSAIAGVVYFDGRPVEPSTLRCMLGRLTHRCPDGASYWHRGSVGLAHGMLWTTPESLHEKLPLVDEPAGLALTADARIDNRDELLPLLAIAGRPAREISDSEVILAAYKRWGEACPEKLVGDFAFAIWDEARQSLFCARDAMSIRPFYYYRTGSLMCFASEIGALFCLPEVPRVLNELRVADYLLLDLDDQERTFYRGVNRLPAATRMVVRPQGAVSSVYWRPDPHRELGLSSDQEYAEALREVFTEAVRCQVRSAFPVASTLSGGLDSSSIACTARDILDESGAKLHTLSAVFPSLAEIDPRIDERHYIDLVLATGGFEPHCIPVDQQTPLLGFHWQRDEPSFAFNIYMDRSFFLEARRLGVRVVLHGIDGDTTVSHGYEYLDELVHEGRWDVFAIEARAIADAWGIPLMRYFRLYAPPRLAELARSGRWPAVARELPRLSHEFALSPRRLLVDEGVAKLLLRQGLKPLVPAGLLRWLRFLHGQDAPIADALPIELVPAFAMRVGRGTREVAPENGAKGAKPSAREEHALGIQSEILREALAEYSQLGACYGVELRGPFNDRRLIEFCVATPPRQKLRLGQNRAIMRQAMEGILPAQVQNRLGKQSLGACLKLRLLEHEGPLLEHAIAGASSRLSEYADLGRLRSALQRYTQDPLKSEKDSMAVFDATTLALWLERPDTPDGAGESSQGPSSLGCELR